jgi:hypothetical protein
MHRLASPLLAGLAAVGLAACGGKVLDTDGLETQLAEQLAPQGGVTPDEISVSCPEDQEVEQGATFDCELTAPNGDKVAVNVTLTDDEGGFEAKVPEQ